MRCRPTGVDPGAGAPLPARITSSTLGLILQPQPAPWLYWVRRIGTAVGLLVVFQHRHQRAAHGQAGTVQGVQQLVLALGILEAGLQAACLEGFAVAHRTDFAVGVLRGQPHFQVIGFGGAKAHVAGAQAHHAVRQVQLLQHGFGVARHFFQRFVALVGCTICTISTLSNWCWRIMPRVSRP